MSPLVDKHATRGFPLGVAFTPVPSPLLGEMLGRIARLDDLRILLRLVWLLNHRPADARHAAAEDLCGDAATARIVGAYGEELEIKVREALRSGIEAEILLEVGGDPPLYTLNTAAARRLARDGGANSRERGDAAATIAAPPFEGASATVTAAYERDIGMVTPLVAEKLNSLLNSHGESEVLEAIGTAVAKNARSIRFVEVVLNNAE